MNNEIVKNAEVNNQQLIGFLDNLGLTQKLTVGEKNTFLEICKAYQLNPFKREIYASKYGENFSIVVGFEVYLKRAERSNLLDGWEIKSEGSVQGNDLKAIITIYRKDRSRPFIHEVYYNEYVQRTKEGRPNKFWAEKPVTMIKKVAMSQGFRLCFSDELGGMPYTSEELDTQTVEEPAQFEVVTPLEDLVKDAIAKLANCNTVEELALFRDTLEDAVISSKYFRTAAKARHSEITNPANNE